MYKIIKTTFKLFIVSFFLSACGGGVEEHFSQNAPDQPVINIAADDKNKWLISLTSDTGAKEYQLYVSDSLALTNPIIIIVDSTNTDAIDIKKLLDDPDNRQLLEASEISINPGESIFLSVVGSFAGKTSQESNVVEYVVQPDEPTGLSKVNLTGNSEIKWAKTTDDGSITYNIYWSTDPNVTGADGNYQGSILNRAIPNFLHDLSAYPDLTKIYYVIYSVQAGVESVVSDTIVITVNKTPTLDTPENLQATLNGSQFNISWKGVDAATDYRLYRSTVENFDLYEVNIIPVSSPDYNDGNVLTNTDYYYWVIALDQTGSSNLSERVGPIRNNDNGTGSGQALPEFTIADSFEVYENETIVTNLTATDIDSNNLIYGISIGFDVFKLVGQQLQFKQAPDLETGPSSYNVTVTVSDLDNVVEKAITVSILNVNESPVFTLTKDVFLVPENTTFVTILSATDVDSTNLTFSLKSANAGDFRIISATKTLEFIALQDYDTTSKLSYSVGIDVTDNHPINPQTASINITVNLTDINEPPIFAGDTAISYPENNTVGYPLDASDPEGLPITFSVTGGANASLFAIASNGSSLIFIAQPTFELGGNNDYTVEISAADGNTIVALGTTKRLYSVTVTEGTAPPVFNIVYIDGLSYFLIAETSTFLMNLNATDPDSAPSQLVYTLFSESEAMFNIVGNVLSLDSPVDFEAQPNRAYSAKVRVKDNTDSIATATINFMVKNVDEAPTFEASINTNFARNVNEPITIVAKVVADDPENQTLTYSIAPTLDGSFFSINSSTGDLVFKSASDYEVLRDGVINNVYEVEVEAQDTAITPNVTRQLFTVTVVNMPEDPFFVTSAIDNQNENSTETMVIQVDDPDGDTLFLELVSGDDSAAFNLTSSGNLTFVTPPDYENPADTGRINSYQITIKINGGSVATVQKIFTFQVLNMNDNAPQFVTPVSLPDYQENNAGSIAIVVNDVDGSSDFSAPSISINGGADYLQFNLSGNLLSFKSPPDYENPTDTDQDNRYFVRLDLDDGLNAIASRVFFVDVTDVKSNLTAPILVTVPAASSPADATGKVIVKWPYIPTNQYYLYYSTQSDTQSGLTPANYRFLNATKLPLPASASSPYTLTGLTMSTPYYFIMTAAKNDITEEGAYSNEQQATPYVPSSPLNDTGQKNCATNDAGPLICNDSTAGTDLFPGQDAEFGLDANTNPNGFRFTKLNGSGAPTTGTAICVRDDNTGLIWELKTNDGGLYDRDDTYSWYNTDTTINSGYSGTPNGGVCSFSGGIGNCNTEEFVNAVNSAGLCGATNWRMPDVGELHGLLNHNILSPGPLIETTVFPNTVTAPYWTNATAAVDISISSTGAWYVNFKNGTALRVSKSGGYSTRLVH